MEQNQIKKYQNDNILKVNLQLEELKDRLEES